MNARGRDEGVDLLSEPTQRQCVARIVLSAALGVALLLAAMLAVGAPAGQVHAGPEPASVTSTDGQGSRSSLWRREIVDSGAWWVDDTSLALEPSPPYTPHISYVDAGHDMNHAWLVGSTWHTETVDSTGSVCGFTSMALEPTPPYTAHISYLDCSPADGLRHAWWTPSGWLSETVDGGPDTGAYMSLALEPAAPHLPHISYFGFPGGALRYAWLSGTTWYTVTVDNSADYVGEQTSLALEPTPPYAPHIVYFDDSNQSLKHAWLSGSIWYSETVDSVVYFGSGGQCTSLALAPTPPYTPHIGFYDAAGSGLLRHAWRAPSGWLSDTVDGGGWGTGMHSSLALEPTPPYTPHISYHDAINHSLKHAWRTPSGWLSETVDNEGYVGWSTSLALEPTPPYTPHISYVNLEPSELRYARVVAVTSRAFLPLVLRNY